MGLGKQEIFQNKSGRFVEIRNAQQSFIVLNKLLFTKILIILIAILLIILIFTSFTSLTYLFSNF
jgi:uncharacterized integral membrane protein